VNRRVPLDYGDRLHGSPRRGLDNNDLALRTDTRPFPAGAARCGVALQVVLLWKRALRPSFG